MAKFPRPTSITGFRTEGHVRKGSRHLQHRAILNLKPRRNPRARRKPRKEMHLHDSRKFSGGSDEMSVCASTGKQPLVSFSLSFMLYMDLADNDIIITTEADIGRDCLFVI